MGERRKRKSMWDVEGETKQFPGKSEHNSSHEFSSSRASAGPKSSDHSGKPSQESNEEKSSVGQLNAGVNKSGQNSPEGKEIGGGGNRYYQNMSPGFDGVERHKYKLESDRSDFLRYPRRNRSRSPSRSNGNPRGRTRSRSPVRDYRNQSEKSFRICREFSLGRCTRGSQCRFLHSKNSNHSHISKDSNFREDKGNIDAKCNNGVLESGAVSIAESFGEKNTGSSIQSYVLEEVNGSGNPVHPILFTVQDMNQNGPSSATDDELNVVRPVLANGFGSDVDGPEAHLETSLDLQSQMLKAQHDAVFQTSGIENAINLPNITETEIQNLTQPDNAKEVENPGNLKLKEETGLVNSEADAGNNNNKFARLFKNSLVEFVKDILKPTWKEGRLSRDVHKTIVKKVVDKVTSTVQDEQIPRTQEKVDQYLLFSKPKISKLVQAYVERSAKTDS